MPRVLVVDDDPGMLKLVERALSARGYQVVTANDGSQGLNRIKAEEPDIVVLDKMMPGIDGFEVARRIRREPGFSHIPILILTGASQLGDKLEAFNAGADDFLTKPFEVDELAARLAALLRRADVFKGARDQAEEPADKAKMIAVHSLRGGVGCTSLAVNLAYSLTSLWQSPTLLVDLVLASGQIALMLNKSIRRSWTDLSVFKEGSYDFDALESVMNKHDSGLHFIAAPKDPIDAEEVGVDTLKKALKLLRPRYHYIVADLPHDFSDIALDSLESSDTILLLLAPEIVSVRAASVTLGTYKELGFPKEKVMLILNRSLSHSSLTGKQIEEALHHPISVVLPYAPKRFINAMNSGVPIMQSDPEDPVSVLIEDLSFRLSKESHQLIPPPSPSAAWHRINNRLSLFGSGRKSSSNGFPLFRRLRNLFR